jgi:molecular chaperone GrpE
MVDEPEGGSPEAAAEDSQPPRARRARADESAGDASSGSGLFAAIDAKEVESLRARAEERDRIHDQWLRATADLQNLRRRLERDAEDRAQRMTEGILLALLSAVDELARAREIAGAGPVRDGLDLIQESLLAAAAKQGVKPLEAVGQAFDPRCHEAISTTETAEVAEGRVAAELRKGYLWHDRVLRPAQVLVAAAPKPETRG